MNTYVEAKSKKETDQEKEKIKGSIKVASMDYT